MKYTKRLVALATASVLALSLSGCSQDSSSWVYKAGDYTTSSGEYLTYVTQSTREAVTKTGADDEAAMFDMQIEDKDAEDWITEDACNTALQQLGVLITFDQEGLTLDQATADQTTSEIDSYYDQSDSYLLFTERGISADSLSTVAIGEQKYDQLFDHFYASGGTKEVAGDDINNYITSHAADYKYIEFSKTNSSSGENYEGEAYDNFKNTVQGYCNEINNDGKSIDDVNKEYQIADGAIEDSVTELTETVSFDNDEEQPKELIDALFQTAQVGGPAIVAESDSSFYVIQRYDVATQTNFDTYHDDALTAMKKDEFEQNLVQTAKDNGLQTNDSAIDKYNPKKLQSIVDDAQKENSVA